MAAPIEDLDFNPFFRNLQTKFEAVYRDAQQRCCLICVPSTQAICDINITEQFIESHIFRPSPYFRGQYISLDKNDEKTIKIEDGVIKSVQGFRNSFKMKIIGEELGYNNDFKTYRIVIVDGIIAEIFKRVTTSQEQLDLIKLDRSSMGSVHSDCREFLARLPAAERLLRSLDAQAQSFSDTYMVLEAYLDDAARKVRQICANCAQDYLHRNPEYAEGPDVKALEAAIESCVTHALHRKVYSVVKRHLAAADSDLQRRLEAFRAMTLAQLEVRSELWFPYTNATCELEKLDQCLTPLEKLYCLKRALDAVSEEINRGQSNESFLLMKKRSLCLAADDLLPICVFLLTRVRGLPLLANLYYAEHFRWSSLRKDDLDFCLTTFQAAACYLQTCKQQQQSPLHSPQTVVCGVSTGIKSMSISAGASQEVRPSEAQPFVYELPRRELLDTEPLGAEAYDKIFGTVHTKSPRVSKEQVVAPLVTSPDVIDLNKSQDVQENGLGDFLTSLQENSLGSTYGTQT